MWTKLCWHTEWLRLIVEVTLSLGFTPGVLHLL
jgi:hypothetical protein